MYSRDRDHEERNKWLNRNILAMGITSFFSDLGHEMATAILPLFLVSVGGSAALLGLIEGMADASISVMKIVSGWYSDHLGKRKPFAMIGYFLTAIGVGSFAFAFSWVQVLGSRVVAWLGRGIREPARDALLADSTERQYYGRVFGFHRGMDTLGAIVGPAVAFLLIKSLSLRSIFLVAFIPSVLSFLAISLFVKEMRKAEPNKTPFIRSIRLLPSRFRIFIIAVGIFGLGNFAPSLIILRATQVLTPIKGAVAAGSFAILLYVVHNVCYAGLSFPIGGLADTFDKKRLLVVGYLLASIASIGFMFDIANPIYLGFFFLLAGASAAFVDALERAIAADHLPVELRATGYGALATVNGIGDFFSSVAVGFLWPAFSPQAGFGYGAIIMVLGAVFLGIRKI